MKRRQFLAVAATGLLAGCSATGERESTPTMTPVALDAGSTATPTAESDRPERLTPTEVIETTEIAPGDSHGFRVVLGEGQQLSLWGAGIVGAESTSSPSPAVTAQLVKTPASNPHIEYETAQAFVRGDPLARLSAAEAGFVTAMRIHNGSDERVEASAAFGYEIERVSER